MNAVPVGVASALVRGFRSARQRADPHRCAYGDSAFNCISEAEGVCFRTTGADARGYGIGVMVVSDPEGFVMR